MGEQIELCTEYWEFALNKIEHCLSKGNRDMVAGYHGRPDIAEYDVQYLFRVGDYVLVNRKIVSKLKS